MSSVAAAVAPRVDALVTTGSRVGRIDGCYVHPDGRDAKDVRRTQPLRASTNLNNLSENFAAEGDVWPPATAKWNRQLYAAGAFFFSA